MSTQRGIDRRTADELLAGTATGPVADVLRAATAPAHPGELAGEEAALTAFRDAALDAARPSRLRSVLAKVLTVKVLVAAAVAGSAGVVLAASGGALPIPLPWKDPAPPPPPPTVTTTEESPSAAPGGPGTPAPSEPAPGDAPDPSFAGLCQAYSKHEKAPDNPAFGPLVTAAGGPEQVPAYCDEVRTAVSQTRPVPPGHTTRTSPPESKPPKPPKPTKTTKSSEPADPSDPGNPAHTGVSRGEHGPPHAPVTPPLGAASAVPPRGAEPPSPGG